MSKIFRLFLKLYIVAAIVLAVSALHSCSVSQSEGKTEPEYKGVDPQLQPLVNEYLLITSKNNVVFNNQVTLGIKDIDDGGAVGLCNYGKKWREIDIDCD